MESNIYDVTNTNVIIENYVAVDNEIYPIDAETISLSKNLFQLKEEK